jgi:hypothetical protein
MKASRTNPLVDENPIAFLVHADKTGETTQVAILAESLETETWAMFYTGH